MKRVLLLLVLLFGVSFACDQSCETIEGIKIGCPYDGDFSAGVVKEDNAKVTIYERSLENSFFDSAIIEVMDGKVESVSLSKILNDLDILKKEREGLFESLDHQWGKGGVIGDNEALIIYVNKTPRSEYLASIIVMSSFIESAGILQVTYASKQLSD